MISRLWRIAILWLQPVQRTGPDIVDWPQITVWVLALVAGSGAVEGVNQGLSRFAPNGMPVLAVALAWTLLLGLRASYRQQEQIDEYRTKPQPNVVFDGFASVDDQQITVDRISQSNKANFARLRFINEPEHKGPEATVPDLHAFVEIRDQADEQVILAVPDGRWADNFDRGEAPSRFTKSVPLPPTGESRILDIAMQRWGEDECYGWDHNGHQIPQPAMPPAKYQVRVELNGSNMDMRCFQFTLNNHGASEFLELVERASFSNVASFRWAKTGQSAERREGSQLRST